ncbi:hypothetical protein B0H13DRAFT_2330547 [Mycena leptocephala]|nr:hypothetical protein B0H13DRAFT_2330547 [Mycena leptocephala]
MADLVRTYNQHTDEDYSLFRRVTTIASKKALDISEVMDRGVSLFAQPVAQFGLETGFLLRTDRTIKEMQALLTKASGLVRGRLTCFTIDPHSIIARVLRSAHDLNELHLAWVGMSERMELAQQNFLKYQSEYSAETEDEILLSPVSTSPDIYSVFPRENSTLALDLNYVFDSVPHMKKLWPKGYQVDVDFLPSIVRAPAYLQQAFPERQPEARPLTVYYSLEGERKEIAVSSRTSHRGGASFELPSEDLRAKGKEKEVQKKDVPPEEPRSESVQEASPTVEYSAGHWNMSDANQGILGTEIPYKDSESFFVPKSPQRTSRATTVPGSGLPNPIFGMATSESYGLVDFKDETHLLISLENADMTSTLTLPDRDAKALQTLLQLAVIPLTQLDLHEIEVIARATVDQPDRAAQEEKMEIPPATRMKEKDRVIVVGMNVGAIRLDDVHDDETPLHTEETETLVEMEGAAMAEAEVAVTG